MNAVAEEQAHLAMSRARAALVLEHPFFASLALRLKLKPDPTCRDLWADGRTIGFNPAYAATLPEKKLVGMQAHEMLHLACGHHIRRKGRDERLWNRACDYAVNQLLLDAGFSLPEGFLYDPLYAGRSVDDIYDALARLQDREANGGAQQMLETGESSEGEGSGGGDGAEGEGKAEPGSGEEGKKSGDAIPRAGRFSQDEGKGIPAPADVSGFMGEVRDHPLLEGREDAARKTAEQEADVALVQALQGAMHMGDMPAGFMRLLRETLRPALDWRSLLQRFLENCTDGDSTWSVPNRRYIFQGLYLPSRREPKIPRVALAVDSSGSVDEASLAAFCAELSSVLDAYDTELIILYHDRQVYPGPVLTRQDMPFSLIPTGGGGTDYRPVCAHIEEYAIEPACLLWFTDLECDRFPDEPPYPVLWVSSGSEECTPPFGEVLRLPRAL